MTETQHRRILHSRDSIDGALLGLLTADLLHRSEGGADGLINDKTFSGPAVEALITLSALGPMISLNTEVLFQQLQEAESTGPWNFDYIHEPDGNLIRCLVFSLWFRLKNEGLAWNELLRVLVNRDSPRGIAATLMLSLWLRNIQRHPNPVSAWEYIRTSHQNMFSLAFEGTEVDDLLNDTHLTSQPTDDRALCMVKTLRRAADANDWDAFLFDALAVPNITTSILDSAALVFGVCNGVTSLPEGWTDLLKGIPSVSEGLQILEEKFIRYPRFASNVEITSENSPLLLLSLPVAMGRFLATTAPGAQRSIGYSDRGLVHENRNMETDVEQLKKEGVTHVLSLLAPDEMQDDGISVLPMTLEGQGIQWWHLSSPRIEEPITEYHGDIKAMLPKLRKALTNGASVAVHASCLQGRMRVVLPQLLRGINPELTPEQADSEVNALLNQGHERLMEQTPI